MRDKRIEDFRELVVWQKAHELFLSIVKDVERFPNTQVGRVISDQILRCSGSISANIAEGFGRKKGKEYLHYLIIARGSTTETINWLTKCLDLGWIGKSRYDDREGVAKEILKMLNKMIGQKI